MNKINYKMNAFFDDISKSNFRMQVYMIKNGKGSSQNLTSQK